MSSDPCGHDIERWLHEKADGRLSQEEAVALARQVGACSACRERAALLEWADRALRQGRRAVPAGFSDQVLRRVAALRFPPRVRARAGRGLLWLSAAPPPWRRAWSPSRCSVTRGTPCPSPLASPSS